MEKSEILEQLQENARQLADREKWLQTHNERRLAEFVCVQRLINFRVQDLISAVPKEEAQKALYLLHADLLASLEHAQEYQSTTLIDLYSSALDYYHTLCNLLDNYLP